jgi:hypothetical protein
VRSGHPAGGRVSRRSRAQWLAFGSTLALAGCGDRTGATTADSVRLPAPAGARRGPTIPAADTFPCDIEGDAIACRRITEYCQSGSPSCGPRGCTPIPSGCTATPTCDCFYEAGLLNTSDCEDDAGGIEVTCPCYGAPPPRLV